MCWLTVRLAETANRLAMRLSEGISYLQVTELEGRRRLGNDLRGLFESSRGFLFALCSNNLKERVKREHIVECVSVSGVATKQHAFALASRAASASAAMALCSWTGRRASLLQKKMVSRLMISRHYYNNYIALLSPMQCCPFLHNDAFQ